MSAIYRKDEELGRGIYTAVYRGWDALLDREVAIKEPIPPFAGNTGYLRMFVARGLRLVDIDHPYVLRVYAVDNRSDQPSVVRELADGTLRGFATSTVSASTIGRLLQHALAGLEAIHGRGLVHGAIKPDNLFLCGNTFKVGDFGVAHASGYPAGPPRHIEYLAPEGLDDPDQLSPSSDIYSLGRVVYALALGRRRFEQLVAEIAGQLAGSLVDGDPDRAELSARFQASQDELPPLHQLEAGVPVALSLVIQKMVRRSPTERYAKVAEVFEALTRAEKEISRTSDTVGRSSHRPAAELLAPQNPPDCPSRSRSPADGIEAARPNRPLLLWVALGGAIILLIVISWSGRRVSSHAVPPPTSVAVREGSGGHGIEPHVVALPALAAPADRHPEPSATQHPERLGVPPGSGAATETPRQVASAESAQPVAARRREMASLRESLRHGIDEAEEAIGRQEFAAARERLAPLLALSAPYGADLRTEVDRLRQLDKQAADGIVETRTAARAADLARDAWQRRLGEIGDLIRDRSFPEAKRLADRLAADPDAPPDVAVRARQLAGSALAGIKSSFSGGGFDRATSRIEPVPPL